MYSLTFQCFRAILWDRHSASDARGRDNAYDYFNIKHNEKESTWNGTQQIICTDGLSREVPGISCGSDFNSVISDPQDIMVRGNEESFMEHGFGVAGLNRCRKVACDKFWRDRLLQRRCFSNRKTCWGLYCGIQMNWSGNTGTTRLLGNQRAVFYYSPLIAHVNCNKDNYR